jgi:uncharacterized membrane protein
MKIRPTLLAAFSFIGMVDAFYLTMKRSNAAAIPCHITHGCSDVLTSKYSVIAGIPLSAIGLGFYLMVFSLAVITIFDDSKMSNRLPLRAIFYFSGVGLIISALLVGIQAFVLKAFCEYCLLSAALVLSIFLTSPNPGRHTLPE